MADEQYTEEGFDPFTPQNGVVQPPNIDIGNMGGEDQYAGPLDTLSFRTTDSDNEVLVPGVDKEGRPLTEDEAIEEYRQTGKHLGIFSSPQDADIFAEQLDNFQGGGRKGQPDEYMAEELTSGARSALNTEVEQQAALDTLQPVDANEEIGNIVEETEPEKRVYGKLEKLPKKMEGPPTLQNYLQYATDSALNNASAASARFPEESDPSLSQALDKADPLRRQVDTIGKLSPEERANTGALIGARAGATFMGRAGATIGGKIGAFAGRGAGVARSGELAKQNRDNRIWNSMKTIGVVAPDGKVKFDDATVTLPSEAVGRLPNLKTNPLNGQKDRTLYETDSTNPLTQRALLAAKPLAMYYANGMLGYKDKKNPVDAEAAKAASAMYANMFTEGVSNAESVYSRARQTAKKMGLKEKQVRGYFSTISADLSFDEAQDIKKGLDIIFAK